jgi:hypothetical protein
LLLVIVAAVLMASCQVSPEAASGGMTGDPVFYSVTKPVLDLNGSGVSGRSTAAELGMLGFRRTRIQINLSAASGDYFAQIYRGPCARLSFPLYELQNVRAGTSTTELRKPLEEITRLPVAVVLLRNADDAHTAVACGDLP